MNETFPSSNDTASNVSTILNGLFDTPKTRAGIFSTTLKAILTSTLPNLVTTEGPSFIAEYGLLLLIIAGIIIVILLMILCICCATRPSSSSSGSRQSVLPTRIPPRPPTETTVHEKESTIFTNKKGEPIIKIKKVTSTHSTSSGKSNHSMQSRGKLLPSKRHHRSQKHHQQHQNSAFSDAHMDPVYAPTVYAPPKKSSQRKHKTAARQEHSQY
uniref:Uncharacterized protein n=1 Tax=Panagrolaimus davidi TaxID=227884 RepID=A0A914QL83_9BILA